MKGWPAARSDRWRQWSSGDPSAKARFARCKHGNDDAPRVDDEDWAPTTAVQSTTEGPKVDELQPRIAVARGEGC